MSKTSSIFYSIGDTKYILVTQLPVTIVDSNGIES